MSIRYRVLHGDTEVTADVESDGQVMVDGRHFRIAAAGPGRYRVTADDGTSRLVAIAGPPHETWAGSAGRSHTLIVDSAPKRAASGRATGADMTAPMPATVVRVSVQVGDHVTAGTPVVVLEAMKMELTIRAARDGIVRAVGCAVGDLVTPGTRLVEIEA